MEKKKFFAPEINLIKIECDQIISCSGPGPSPVNPVDALSDIKDTTEII